MKTEVYISDEEWQQRVRETVMKCAGTIVDRPDLAENARSEVRARLHAGMDLDRAVSDRS
jgi:hypothetical protein